jgi:D-amino-acid dehydrogenase
VPPNGLATGPSGSDPAASCGTVASVRVIVVGAGIVGASAAWHLAAQGTQVVLVDQADQGQATAAGAGIVAPWPRPDTPAPIAALGLAAAEHYPRLLDALVAAGMDDHSYARVGGIHVAPDGPELEQLHRGLLRLRRQPGMAGLGTIERLPPGEPAARFPPLRADLAGLAASGIGRVDGRRLRDALLGSAAAAGAQRRAGQATLTLAPGTGRVAGVTVDGEVLAADAVVVAAGAWSARLCRPLGVTLPVFPQRGQLLHLDLPGRDQDTAEWPVIQTTGDHYLLAFPGGRVVAGATRESDAGFDHRVTLGGVHQVAANALALAPGLAQGTVAEVRVGFRPLTSDGLPLLGGIEGVRGLVVATGLGPVGLTLGPYVGAVAADLALGNDVPLDMAPYRPDRRVGSG